MYAVAVIFAALFAGKIVDRAGHAKIMAIGVFVMSTSVAAYSLAIFLDKNW